MHWILKFLLKIFLFNSACMTGTDIGVIYEHGILLLRNASTLSSKITQKAEELVVNLPHKFEYPIALAYDPIQGLLFVSDANNKDTEIFSLLINNKNITVNSLIPKQKQSLIDAIAYDPVKNRLLWTDSFKHGIYYANIHNINSTASSTVIPVVIASSEVFQPRGIAIDYCNRFVYWTERHSKNPVIKRYSMIDYNVEIIKIAPNGSFFQGVNYNIHRKELIWAETLGDDERNSSCNIVTKSVENGVENIIGSFNHCYPFSLTSDLDFIYWSDWSRSGIMRLARTDNSNESLVKLVDTPALKTEEGRHNGAFGIVNLRNYFNVSNSACVFQVNENGSNVKSTKKPAERNETDYISSFHSTMTSGSQGLVGSFKDSYAYHNLRLTIIILAFGCSFFLSTTLLLLSRIVLGQGGCLRAIRKFHISTTDNASASNCVKKIKPHRRFQSKRKSFDGQLCAKDNDGIKIDIEDCCQMTLCDTPCYTSLKKDGKGYKLSSKSINNEDKEKLLQNIGVI